MKSVTDCPNPLTPVIPHFLMLLLLYLLARGVRAGRFRTCEEVAFIRLHVFARVQSAFYFSFDAFFLWRRIMRPGVVITWKRKLVKGTKFQKFLLILQMCLMIKRSIGCDSLVKSQNFRLWFHKRLQFKLGMKKMSTKIKQKRKKKQSFTLNLFDILLIIHNVYQLFTKKINYLYKINISKIYFCLSFYKNSYVFLVDSLHSLHI